MSGIITCPFLPCGLGVTVLDNDLIEPHDMWRRSPITPCPASLMSWPLTPAARNLLHELIGSYRDLDRPAQPSSGHEAGPSAAVGKPAIGDNYFPTRPSEADESGPDNNAPINPATTGIIPLGRAAVSDSMAQQLQASTDLALAAIAHAQETCAVASQAATDLTAAAAQAKEQAEQAGVMATAAVGGSSSDAAANAAAQVRHAAGRLETMTGQASAAVVELENIFAFLVTAHENLTAYRPGI